MIKSHLYRSSLKSHIIDTHFAAKKSRFRQCPVKSCTTIAARGFYRVPEHPLRRQDWLKACNLPSDIAISATICWKHFKKEDFKNEMDPKHVNMTGMGNLKQYVIPSQNLPSKNLNQLKDFDMQEVKEEIIGDFVNISNDFQMKKDKNEWDSNESMIEYSDKAKNEIYQHVKSPNYRVSIPSQNSELKKCNQMILKVKDQSKGAMKTTSQKPWNKYKDLIFCITCGNNFEKVENLSTHLENNSKCRNKHNLNYLSQLIIEKGLEKDIEYCKKTDKINAQWYNEENVDISIYSVKSGSQVHLGKETLDFRNSVMEKKSYIQKEKEKSVKMDIHNFSDNSEDFTMLNYNEANLPSAKKVFSDLDSKTFQTNKDPLDIS